MYVLRQSTSLPNPSTSPSLLWWLGGAGRTTSNPHVAGVRNEDYDRILAVGLLANFLPARRAAALDPMRAVHFE